MYPWDEIADFKQLMEETVTAAKHCLEYSIEGYLNYTFKDKKVLSENEIKELAEHLYECGDYSHGHGCYKNELEDLDAILSCMDEKITLRELSAIMQRYDKITHRDIYSEQYYGGDRENLARAVEYVINKRSKK